MPAATARGAAMRPGLALALTVLSGSLYGLAFPTAQIELLAYVALVPFLLALRDAPRARALGLAWVWTIVAAWSVGDWFPRAVATYYAQPLAVGIAFFFGVSTFLAAPYYAVFALCARALARRPGPALPLLIAAAWVAAELARGRLFAGNPWALLGYSQMEVPALIQIADLTGVYGVSFVVVAVNAALAGLVTRAPPARRRALAGAGLAAAVLAATLVYGRARLAAGPDGPDAGPPTTVAMVQGNLDLGSQWREEFYGRNLAVYLGLTHALLQERPIPLVFWPESALTFFLDEEAQYRGAIASVLSRHGTQLVTGGPRKVAGEPPTYRNAVYLVGSDGALLAWYDKQRLVPFAEHFPLGIDALRRQFAQVREYTPGAPSPPLPTVLGPAGVTICNEAMFPEIAAARVREGAVYFVDPAHDTWLTPKFSAQQFDIVRLRTVEQRRYLVRASTSGPSAIVDPLGQVRVRTAFLERDAIHGAIRVRTVRTPYHRLGDLFAWACLAVALVGWWRRRGA